MAVHLEKVVGENKEEIVAQIVTYMRREMPTYEALPMDEVRSRVSVLVDMLHEALVKNERQTWDDFVERMVRQRLKEGYALAEIQQVIDIVERVLLSVIARAYRRDPHAVRGAKSRFIESFMFETRATVDKAYKRSAEMASR
jgi:transposase-like protein